MKTKVVIVGAGPSGLFAALELYLAGVNDILVVDPRVNQYVRFGFLDQSVFEKARNALNAKYPGFLNFDPAAFSRHLHIKDFERMLYQKIITIEEIQIEPKKFDRLYRDANQPGVVIVDNEGNEEYIPANYVFDCTGTKRQVVNSVNQVLRSRPFGLHPYTAVTTPRQFMAYVKIDSEQVKKIKNKKHKKDSIHFAQSLAELRALGWKEWVMPKLKMMTINPTKSAFYVAAPDNLLAEDQEKWFQAVLRAYAGEDVYYEQLPPSKKYPNKVKLSTFNVTANVLEPKMYWGYHLPCMFPVGDTLIDPYFKLGKGISFGIEIFDALVQKLTIIEGIIMHVDEKGYQQILEEKVAIYKKEVDGAMTEEKINFHLGEKQTRKHFQEVMEISEYSKEIYILQDLYDELSERKSYTKGIYYLKSYYEHKPNGSSYLTDIVKAYRYLLKAVQELPSKYEDETQRAKYFLSAIAKELISLASEEYEGSRFAAANNFLRKALQVYVTLNNQAEADYVTNLIATCDYYLADRKTSKNSVTAGF